MATDNYIIRVTNQALSQMEEINDYIAHELCAPMAAHNLLDKLENSMQKLSLLPQKHMLIAEEPWHSKGIRKITVNNFFVYYWVNDIENYVQIIAVIYAKRDQVKALREIRKD